MERVVSLRGRGWSCAAQGNTQQLTLLSAPLWAPAGGCAPQSSDSTELGLSLALSHPTLQKLSPFYASAELRAGPWQQQQPPHLSCAHWREWGGSKAWGL